MVKWPWLPLVALSACAPGAMVVKPGQAQEIKPPLVTFTFNNISPDYVYNYWLYYLDHDYPELRGRAQDIAGGELKPKEKHTVTGDYDPGGYVICWQSPLMEARLCWGVGVYPNTREIEFTPVGERGWFWEVVLN